MDKRTTIAIFNDFVNAAERSRKYPRNTAIGYRAALRLYEQVLKDEEKESIDTFKERLEDISSEVYHNNISQMTAGSIATYKSRVFRVLGDYEKYGREPAKMANWKPIKRTRGDRKSQDDPKSANERPAQSPELRASKSKLGMVSWELPSRNDPESKSFIITPRNLHPQDAQDMIDYLGYLKQTVTKQEKKPVKTDDDGGVSEGK